MTEQLFEKICWLLAPRAGGAEIVKRLGGPPDEGTWGRWIEAGLLTQEEGARLAALNPVAAQFSDLQRALNPPAEEGDWSVDITGELTLPNLEFSSVDLSWEELDASLGEPLRFEQGIRHSQTQIYTTFEARDARLGRDLLLHKHRAGGPLTSEEFILAVQRQANLQHANIRTIYELGLDESDVPFFVTSRFEGRGFHELLNDLFGRREAAESTLSARVEILLDVARALAFAHQHGFIHRDLRPKQIKVGHFGEVYLDGWFRARSLESPPFEDLDQRLARVHSGKGFLPPERLRGGLSVCEAAADIYSLGALLYASFGLSPPQSGPEPLQSNLEVLPAGEQLPKRLLDLCHGALEPDPSRRLMSVHDFISELEEYLDGRKAEERRGEQVEALLAGIQVESKRFQEHDAALTEAIYQAGSTAESPDQLARRTQEAFLDAEMACMRAFAVAPQHPNIRWQTCALHLQALHSPVRALIGVPKGYLEGTLSRYAPPQFTAQLNAQIKLELKTRPRTSVSLHPISDENGVCTELQGRPLNKTPLKLLDLRSEPLVLRLHDDRGRHFALHVNPSPGAQLELDVALPEEVPKGFIFVPAGEFTCGFELGGAGWGPKRAVSLEGFFIARDPVSFRTYAAFLNDLEPTEAATYAPKAYTGGPPLWRPEEGRYALPFEAPEGRTIKANEPLFGISRRDILAFLDWLSMRDAHPYRLPTGLEWEKAARGADGRVYPWGDRPEPEFTARAEGTQPFNPQDESPYGLRGMASGVREYAQGEEGLCLKGGAWGLPFSEARAFLETPVEADTPLLHVGLRLAISFNDTERRQRWSIPDRRTIPELFPHYERDEDRSGIFENELSQELLLNQAPADRGPPPSRDELDDGADRYLLGEELARGSMGRVLLAFDTVLKRQVALKILHDRHQENTLARYRFAMEARITGRLHHPLLIPIYDMGYLPNGSPFFAMKRVEGANLHELIKQRTASARVDHRLDWFLNIMRRVCQGVAFANQNRVIHRDLKPANILIGAFGEVVIVDLGLARQLDLDEADRRDVPEAAELAREDGRVTQIGSIIGTPYYMSPEQAMGQLDKVGPNSDVYGLGAIIYHLIAHRPPFPGRKVNEVLEKVRKGDPKPPSELIAGVDPELERIILKALRKDPGERQSNARVLAQEIAAWQERVRLRRMDQALAEERQEAIAEDWRVFTSEVKRLETLRRQIRQLHREVHQGAPMERRRLFWHARREQSQAEERVNEALSVALRQSVATGLTQGRLEVFKYYFRQLEQRPCPRVRAWYRRLMERLQPRGPLSEWFNKTAPALIQTHPNNLKLSLKSAQTGATFYRTQTPLKIKNLQPGAYVAAIRFHDQIVRAPFTIQREKPVNLELDCRRRVHPGFIQIPRGPFLYGSEEEGVDQSPRWVVLSDFQIADRPINVHEYKRFLKALSKANPQEQAAREPKLYPGGPSLWSPEIARIFGPFDEEEPVTGISLDDARAYAEWRAERDGLPLRLPSNLEWEKAARGVDGHLWGEDISHVPRGCALSPFGLDIRGQRLLEWTLSDAPDDPQPCYVRGGDGLGRFHSDAITRRLEWAPSARDPRLGFRLVLQTPVFSEKR